MTLNTDGSFTYVHDGSETTTDSFTYRVNDGGCDSNEVTVTLNITPVNDCPIGVDDTYIVNEGETLTIGTKAGAGGGVILGTVGGSKTAGAADSDIDSDDNNLIATKASDPLYHVGAFVLNADGTFVYTHDGSETTTDSFTYTLNDQDGCAASAPLTVTINITQTNDCPVGNADTYTVAEGGTLVLDDHDGTANADANDNGIKANDTGDEESNKYVLGWELVAAPSNGVIQNQTANGELQYVHNGLNTNADTFTYRYIDAGCVGGGFSPAITVTINITPIDNCPVARPDSYIDIARKNLQSDIDKRNKKNKTKGDLGSVYHSTTLMVQEKTSLSKMHTIRETFFQYFYRTHMDGDPHFPLTPTNTDTLMDQSWSNTPIDPQVSLKTPADLFSDGEVPKNANNHPFKYSTWKDTISSTGEIRYFIRITDVDTESAAFGKSFTHSI